MFTTYSTQLYGQTRICYALNDILIHSSIKPYHQHIAVQYKPGTYDLTDWKLVLNIARSSYCTILHHHHGDNIRFFTMHNNTCISTQHHMIQYPYTDSNDK